MHLNEINEPISQCVDCVTNLGIQLKKDLIFTTEQRREGFELQFVLKLFLYL